MSDLSWTEPESPAAPVYPYNTVTNTEAGHLFELDDTPGHERVRLSHGKSKTFCEWHPNGDEVHKIYGTGYEIIANGKNVHITGACNITVEGPSVFHVQGDSHIQVDGDVHQQVTGKVNQVIEGGCEQTVQGDFDLNVSNNFNISASKVNINSDLMVRGNISTTQSIAAKGNIAATLSVIANKSVETSGYMIAATTIAAGISVYGPTISDMFGSMEMFRLKVDQHVHFGVKGGPDTSGVPTSPME
jgi:hypothetical protein